MTLLHRQNETKSEKKTILMDLVGLESPREARFGGGADRGICVLRRDCAMMQRCCGAGLFGADGKKILGDRLSFFSIFVCSPTERPTESQIRQVQEPLGTTSYPTAPHGDTLLTPCTLFNTSQDHTQIPQRADERAWMFDWGCRVTGMNRGGRGVGTRRGSNRQQ